jgi:hypothetical protein
VTDSTGAAIPGVSLRLIHIEMNIVSRATSNESGAYEANFLPIGLYRLEAEQPGFKAFHRSPIEVRIGARVRVDIQLEIGEVSEKIEVTGTAPVLETTTGSVGTVLDSRQISNMAMRGGDLTWLMATAQTTILRSLPAGGPWNVDQTAQLAVAGAKNGGIDFNVDGVSNNSYGGRASFVPPPDMVQEVKINVTSYDASIGHSAGGFIDVSLKSGTNRLTGSLGASLSTGPMMTRNYFTNQFIFDPTTGPITREKIKANTPMIRWLRYSAAVGGPVVLPKLYNGRNRTFWMFGIQVHNRNRPITSLHTVPTAAMRAGDFSALLSLGPNYQIYDPFTTVPAPNNRFRRNPLPGNIIPPTRIDPAARAFSRYFPDPNLPGTVEFLNNYSRTRPEKQDLYQPITRLDHVFTEKNRMYFRYSHSDFQGQFDEFVAGSPVRGRFRERPHRGVALDDVHVLSPRAMLNVRYGFTWFRENEYFANRGWDLSEFGFPSRLISQLDRRAITFPELNIAGMLALGNNGGFTRSNYSHSLLTLLNYTPGQHSLKVGIDGRTLLENAQNFGNVSPAITVNANFTRGPLDNSPPAPAGQAFASFLFGIPSGGGIDLNDSRAERSPFYSFFVQDDWRVSRKLALNFGLRWEYEGPIVERFNRTSSDFDLVSVNPIQDQARAQYAQAPIPEIPADAFRTVGGLTFAGVGGRPRAIRRPDYRVFMPRFGFAYQMTRKLVLRGGYGIFFHLLGAEFDDVAQPNFNRRTNIVPTNDNGQTFVASLSNPLPNGLDRPAGASEGLRTFLGRSPGFFAEDGRRPYTQRWNAGIQFEPLERTVFEVGYIGSRSTRLRVITNLNPVPREMQSVLPERDQATIDFLTAAVRNPFRGIRGFEGTGFFTNLNTTRAQLLQPRPHFTALNTGLPAGMSWYNAFSFRAERRFHRGLQLQLNYTWSKTMEATSYLNETDPAPEYVLSDIDRTHRLSLTSVWELPLGRGRAFASQAPGVVDALIGGWQLQALWQKQSGPAIGFGNAILRGTFDQVALSRRDRSLQRWFNTEVFERNPQRQLENNLRALSTRIGAVRADGIDVWDISLIKNIRVHERLTIQLRGEAEGAMNHPNFAAPNTNPVNTLFGTVNATQTGQEERRIFVGLRLLF